MSLKSPIHNLFHCSGKPIQNIIYSNSAAVNYTVFMKIIIKNVENC